MTPRFLGLIFFLACTSRVCYADVLNDVADTIEDADKKLTAELKTFRNILGALSHQVMLQQLLAEERIRPDGDSGVKQVRLGHDGTRNYYSETHGFSNRLLAIHEHANNIRTVGLGEFVGVLNGVEFRTRHNDYRLFMASTTSTDYHATEEIPFPEVPPEVKNKATVDKQVVEMCEWFKAWKDQNYTVRDYRKYFKPVLCYLEGAWSTATEDIDEPFESDRHFIDATSWFDLQEKVRFTSYTGRKDNLENFSFLPTTIIDIINGTIPVFAQWNYRILCHPLSRDVPLNRFRMVDELHSRLPAERKYEEQTNTRAARFQLNPKDSDKWSDGFKNNPRFTLLDELMEEIPEKDNYPGNLTDDAFNLPAQNANLFVAMNSQPKVAGMKLKTCKGPKRRPRCTTVSQKYSYAIPLEIIYMTPLNSWNPFKLEYKGSEREPYGKTVFQGGRSGGRTPDKAYNGTNSKKYYQTPSAFYTGQEISTDSADTAKNSVGVLDRDGKTVRICRASGTRIFLPDIDGVGVLRQRYPIMPVHGEGSAMWKELEATKDLLMKSQSYGYLYREPIAGSGVLPTAPTDRPLTLRMADATKTPPGPHQHEITLKAQEVKDAKTGRKSFRKLTTTGAGHQHNIVVAWRNNNWEIRRCDKFDNEQYKCRDQHGIYLSEDKSV
ncbi:hypothetical protein AWC38_SpisGene7133 [Stylophora pistillata]|uniref:Uncharacterized protein n=1 Tax=Stylophora pistillata TaxID=50429 RepID=A0A2B4SGE5_STYPI|nr:hypothetical protein AWC38_SpisGene7133 [Stylophora pistillata]